MLPRPDGEVRRNEKEQRPAETPEKVYVTFVAKKEDDGTIIKREPYELEYNGTVDRVDAFSTDTDTYVRVIDYKTGSKTFSPDDIAEGRNLQMFLYLKAITETEKPRFRELIGAKEGARLVPAGVIYVKTRVKDVTLDIPDDALAVETVKSLQERDGMLLDDDISISAMNKNYLPVKFKDGSVADSAKRHLYTERSWKKIGETIKEVINGVCADMRSGNIPAVSTDKNGNSSCTFCSFRSVCRTPSKKDVF